MKKNLIKMICVAVLAITATSLTAQEKGEMAIGVYGAFGTGDSYSNIGFGAKFQWNVIDNLRLEPSFTYFLEKDMISMWDASLNVHYLFPIADKVIIYPLVGAGMLGTSVSVDLGEWGDVSGSTTDFGINLGGGIDFKLTDKLILNAEAKYKIVKDWNRIVISAGVAYKF